MSAALEKQCAPLIRHAKVDTRDPGAAEEAVGRIFCAHRLTPVRRSAPHFHAQHNSARHDGFSINYVAYGADVEIDPGRLDRFFLLQIPLIGAADVPCGGVSDEASPRTASLLSPTLPTLMRWREGVEKLIVLIDRGVVEAHASSLFDRAIDQVEFDPAAPLDAPAGAAMRAQALLMQSLSEKDRSAERRTLAHRQLRDSLVGLMLAAHPHNHSTRLSAPIAMAVPAHVKRAEDFLAAHVHELSSVVDVAVAAGVSLRALQSGFRRFRDKTLSDAILEARLGRWRDLLCDDVKTESVADLALAAGLTHAGRAAGLYRSRYGEAPSETRRRVRRRS